MADVKPVIITSQVVDNRALADETFLMAIDCPEVAASAGPGRFVKIRPCAGASQAGGPFLDRPLSIHRAHDNRLELLYRTVGPATRLLSRLRPGDQVKISGSLGRGLDRVMEPDQDLYLVAGGIGLAPMALAGDYFHPHTRPRLFYGERSGSFQVDQKWLETWAGNYEATTEDGTGYGGAGLVTGPLEEALKLEVKPIFACGPTPMLRAVSQLAERYAAPVWTSVEAGMACGFGVCLTCSLPLKNGGRFRVCQEGPVVDGLSVDWNGVK